MSHSRNFLVLVLLLFMSIGEAQVNSKQAVGLRLGASEGFAAEISYQITISNYNRLEFDFGWRSADSYDGYRLVGLYQWVWNINSSLDWYTGGGAGYSNFNFNTGGNEGVPFFSGIIGIELQTNLPLQITADLRPQFNLNSKVDFTELDFGLGVRYQF